MFKNVPGKLSCREAQDSQIFISYRRADAAKAHWLKCELQDRFGSKRVFIDNDMSAGENWIEKLESEITHCRVFIPLVTDSYFGRSENSSDKSNFRIESEDDFIRRELEIAVKRVKQSSINPSGVDLVIMPFKFSRDELPEASEFNADTRVLYEELTSFNYSNIEFSERKILQSKDLKNIMKELRSGIGERRKFGYLQSLAFYLQRKTVDVFRVTRNSLAVGFMAGLIAVSAAGIYLAGSKSRIIDLDTATGIKDGFHNLSKAVRNIDIKVDSRVLASSMNEDEKSAFSSLSLVDQLQNLDSLVVDSAQPDNASEGDNQISIDELKEVWRVEAWSESKYNAGFELAEFYSAEGLVCEIRENLNCYENKEATTLYSDARDYLTGLKHQLTSLEHEDTLATGWICKLASRFTTLKKVGVNNSLESAGKLFKTYFELSDEDSIADGGCHSSFASFLLEKYDAKKKGESADSTVLSSLLEQYAKEKVAEANIYLTKAELEALSPAVKSQFGASSIEALFSAMENIVLRDEGADEAISLVIAKLDQAYEDGKMASVSLEHRYHQYVGMHQLMNEEYNEALQSFSMVASLVKDRLSLASLE